MCYVPTCRLFIEKQPYFQANRSMSLSKTPSKMELNSRLDEKPISCGKNQGLQSVTLQYQFYFQKFSDFLRARTQNVHLMMLYYG